MKKIDTICSIIIFILFCFEFYCLAKVIFTIEIHYGMLCFVSLVFIIGVYLIWRKIEDKFYMSKELQKNK